MRSNSICHIWHITIRFAERFTYFKGFDTRGTEYSGPRLTWEKVAWNLQMGNRVVLSNTTTMRKNRLKRSWADELLNTFGQVACYEAAIPGSIILFSFIHYH